MAWKEENGLYIEVKETIRQVELTPIKHGTSFYWAFEVVQYLNGTPLALEN